MIYVIAIFAPLGGAIIAGMFGRIIGDKAALALSIALTVVAGICGPLACYEVLSGITGRGTAELGTWIQAGPFHVSWALRHDALSVVMVAMICFISALINIYSLGYMADDRYPRYRFFAYLSLFTFSMLMLVSADDLLQLFFGWEGVGLCSYLLIGYWFERPSANAAAIKAFVANRIADLPFVIGLVLIFHTFGSMEFGSIFAHAQSHAGDTYVLIGAHIRTLEIIGVLLFIGAMGKSAQIALHVWLPDAMEGPTPVSALIHAATMVTAGVFLMARMSPLMEMAPFALGMVTVVGAITAFFAATVGCVQTDIKKVIAYSTCSQLGYMFVAAGVGAFQASMLHVICHAFFKALLFLSAGSVMHAMSDEQDMRRMGGIWRRIPWTYAMMWVGSLALAGIPPFAGAYSKDAILEAALANGSPVALIGYASGVISAGLTAFYSWRLLFMTFHGQPRADRLVMEHVHESPWIMIGPLLVLGLGALFAGMLLTDAFVGPSWRTLWGASIFISRDNHVLRAMQSIPATIRQVPLAFAILGIAAAYVMYVRALTFPAKLAAVFPGTYKFLLHKWYFDELYEFIFFRPYARLSRFLWRVADMGAIDAAPNGLAAAALKSSRQVVKLQTGMVTTYAFVITAGAAGFVGMIMLLR